MQINSEKYGLQDTLSRRLYIYVAVNFGVFEWCISCKQFLVVLSVKLRGTSCKRLALVCTTDCTKVFHYKLMVLCSFLGFLSVVYL